MTDEGPRLLVVCTANICRSRIAEVVLTREAARRGVALGVDSAGTIEVELEVPAEVRELLGESAAPLLDKPPRQVTEDAVASANLVICMAREHVREVAVVAPGAFERTFTLKELLRHSKEAGGGLGRGEDLGDWVARLHSGRTVTELLGESLDDDVEDPYGGGRADYERAIAEITAGCVALLDLLQIASS